MRPLKFRVYDKENKRYCTGVGISQVFTDMTNGELATIFLNSAFAGQYIVEQFTGEYDKEGKEIYDGDTLRWVKPTGMAIEKTVEWSQDYDQYLVGGYTLAGVVSSGCRVIKR